jgi:hypothetical protein
MTWKLYDHVLIVRVWIPTLSRAFCGQRALKIVPIRAITMGELQGIVKLAG